MSDLPAKESARQAALLVPGQPVIHAADVKVGDNETTLDDAITEQIHRVDHRVSGANDLYSTERADVRRAAAQALHVRAALDIGQFLGTVGPPSGKPHFRLLFDSPQHGPVVLKVYGRRRPAEAKVQQMWHRDGVRVVDIIDAGDDPVSWLLMPQLRLAPLLGDSSPVRSHIDLTRELATVMAGAHTLESSELLVSTDADLQHLDEAITHHLGIVLIALRRAGYSVREDWQQKTHLLCTGGSTLLHGDLATGNVVRDAADNQLRLIDTCGYVGPAAFDAARWAARTGGATAAHDLLQCWLRTESDLDNKLAYGLLGMELLMEAGVREIIKQEQGRQPDVPDPETISLITKADQLLDQIDFR